MVPQGRWDVDYSDDWSERAVVQRVAVEARARRSVWRAVALPRRVLETARVCDDHGVQVRVLAVVIGLLLECRRGCDVR